MNNTSQIAKHLRDVYFGGNWSTSNYKQHLSDLSWQEASKQVQDFNTILTLVYHTHYYTAVITKVLLGGPLEGKDEFSFIHPPLQSEQEWQALLDKVWTDAENFAQLIEQQPDSILEEDFTDKKYGTYFRHLHGMVEHLHYHLGQIVLIKKMIRGADSK